MKGDSAESSLLRFLPTQNRSDIAAKNGHPLFHLIANEQP